MTSVNFISTRSSKLNFDIQQKFYCYITLYFLYVLIQRFCREYEDKFEKMTTTGNKFISYELLTGIYSRKLGGKKVVPHVACNRWSSACKPRKDTSWFYSSSPEKYVGILE